METVLAILAGITVGVTTSVITVWLSLRRFRAEKWWESRARAYERVIESLYTARVSTEVYLDAEKEGRNIEDGVRKEFSKRSLEARLDIARAATIGGFLFGDSARERLETFLADRQTAADESDWSAYLQKVWDIENSCLQDIINIARHELRIEIRSSRYKRLAKWARRDVAKCDYSL